MNHYEIAQNFLDNSLLGVSDYSLDGFFVCKNGLRERIEYDHMHYYVYAYLENYKAFNIGDIAKIVYHMEHILVRRQIEKLWYG